MTQEALGKQLGMLRVDPPRLDGARIELSFHGTDRTGVSTDFTEVIELPGTLSKAPTDTVVPVLRLLALAASLSYFKAYAPGTIEVPTGLSAQERRFLDELLKNGLGEFAYVNDLPDVFDTTISGPSVTPAATAPTSSAVPPVVDRVLVAVGGGKDSIVSIEALKYAGKDVGLFSVNSYQPIQDTAEVAGIALASARRRLDPELFRLNAEGAPNGHVPVTAVNSLVAVLTAMALEFDTVAFSNEASSSYGNLAWHGRTVNHQWSKGVEFERLLRASLPADAPNYVSLLRPLTELRIARRFARHTQYHPVFTSCNRAFKLAEQDRTSWCADCPKCRFVFLCLAPFLSRSELLAIFSGRDMFADQTQHEGFLALLGEQGLVKPFECVGEPDECRVALSLLAEHSDWRNHPFLHLPQVVALRAGEADQGAVFAFGEGEHCLPGELEAIAREI